MSRIRASTWDCLFLVAAPLCQTFSGLGPQPGLQDPRCAALRAFVIIRDELSSKISLDNGRRFHWLLEEVASMSVDKPSAAECPIGWPAGLPQRSRLGLGAAPEALLGH